MKVFLDIVRSWVSLLYYSSVGSKFRTSAYEAINFAPASVREDYRQHWRMFVLAACVVSFATIGRAEVLLVEGAFESRIMNRLDFQSRFALQVDLQNQVWRIDDLVYPPRTAYSFNGFVLDRPKLHGMNNTQVVASAYVSGYPIDLDEDQRLIWLVYCAAEILKTNQSKPLILPSGDTRYDPEVHSCLATVKWRNEFDLSPSGIDFIYDSDLMRKSEKHLSYELPGNFLVKRNERLQAFLASWTSGMLMARFQVTSWTNILDRGVPLTWSCELFMNGKAIKTYDGRTLTVAQAKVFSMPPIPETALMYDQRVRNTEYSVNAVHYIVTNGLIPDVSSSFVLSLAAKTSTEANVRLPPGLAQTRAIFMILLAIVVMAPVVVMIYGRMRKVATSASD